jgi:hypothetical protein
MAPKGSELWKIKNFTDMFWELSNRGEWTESSWTFDWNEWMFGQFMMKGNVSLVLSAGRFFRSMTTRPNEFGVI